MRLAHVRIHNILGIDELEFDAGAFTVIEGRNGGGKTSVLEALKSVVKGGEDVTLLRKGATEGEVVWLFDDGTQARKRVTEKTQTVTVEKDGVKQGSPATTIKGWVDLLSVNPVDFLRADSKRRVNVLLESLPMKADQDRLRQIVGDPQLRIVGDHALVQIQNARTVVFDDRTGTNRAIREKEATISQLSATLPSESQVAGGDEAALETELAELDEAQNSEMARIDNKLGGMKASHDAEIEGLRSEIARLQHDIATRVAAFAETQGRASQQRSISTAKWRESRQPIVDALNLIRANRDAAVRAQTTRETIKNLSSEAEALRSDADRQTAAIEALDTYKTELLAALPIDGLEVRDGEIYRRGIPFDRLNKAQQVEIAVEIAKLRCGPLKVICVDELEMLDSEHFEAFQAQALASGLQLIVTRVTDGDLAVRTLG